MVNALDDLPAEFRGSCFESVVSLGDMDVFRGAINPKLLEVRAASPGTKLMSWWRGASASTEDRPGRSDLMYFPFEIFTSSGPAPLDRRQKETIWHETVHHIESLHGMRQLVTFENEPAYREHNEAYLDEAFRWLQELRLVEQQMMKRPDGDSVEVWEKWKAEEGRPKLEKIAARFADLERGVATKEFLQDKFKPGNKELWPPDLNQLEHWTGIRIRFGDIVRKYASGACGADLKAFAAGLGTKASTAKANRDLLNCACQCGASIIGAGYHPEPGGDSPSCANLANGPCMGGQGGCYRWKMQTSGTCVEACFASRKLPFDAAAGSTLQSANTVAANASGDGAGTTGGAATTEGATATRGLMKAGIAEHNQQNYTGAIVDFSEALAVNPRLAEGYRRRGMAKRELKDYAGAMSDFSKAIELDPQSAQAFAGRGLVRERSGDLEGATKDYTRALELDPRYENALQYRSLLELRQKDFAAAKADCERLIAVNPGFAPAHANRGMAREQTGDLQGAFADYEHALALSPSDAFAREGAARMRARLGSGSGESTSPRGTSSSGTVHPANSRGDAFEGGIWCNARNGSDWLQRTFDGIYEIREIRVAKAGTDVSTKGARIVLKLQRPDGSWDVVDELRDTNIGWAELSGGARGNSLSDYRKVLSSPLASRAFRMELSGNGWFSVTDVRLSGTLVSR